MVGFASAADPLDDAELGRLDERDELGHERMLPELHERDKFIELLADQAQKKNVVVKGYPPSYDRPVEGIMGIQDPQNFRRDIWNWSGQADFKGLCEYLNLLEDFQFKQVYPNLHLLKDLIK